MGTHARSVFSEAYAGTLRTERLTDLLLLVEQVTLWPQYAGTMIARIEKYRSFGYYAELQAEEMDRLHNTLKIRGSASVGQKE